MTTPTTKLTDKFDPLRVELEDHPLADIFPLMEGGKKGVEFAALVEDIKAYGLREPITLFEGKILDGRNRYRAIIKASLRYKLKEENFWVFDPKVNGDPQAYVISVNLHRRHLTESQRAVIAANLATKKVGDNQYVKAGISAADAAKMLGVGEATVTMAKSVAEKATDEIKAKVLKGELRLNMAKKIIEKSKDEQQAELERIVNERKERQDAAKAKANAKRKAAKTGTTTETKEPEANQAMTDLDNFVKKWQGFNPMQRRMFVTKFRDDLTTLLNNVREEEKLRGSLNLVTQEEKEEQQAAA
jgi:transposase